MTHFKLFPYIIFLSCIFSSKILAQTLPAYEPIKDDEKQKNLSKTIVENRFSTIYDNLPNKHRADFKKLYQNLEKEHIASIKKGDIIFDEKLNTFFKGILSEIQTTNPSIIPPNIQFLVARNSAPNAVTYIDGTIIFNISLLAAYENESQVAFVICHELAHYNQKHGLNAYTKLLDYINSEKFKKDVKTLSKAEYNVYEKAQKMLKGVVYDARRHSRDNEAESDSIAVLYMLKTRFDAREALSALKILDSLDEKLHFPNFKLEETFNFADYKFKKSWLLNDDDEIFSGLSQKKEDDEFVKDSLATHPECSLRYDLLLNSFFKDNKPTEKKKNALYSDDAVANIINIAQNETLLTEFNNYEIDACLLHALNRLTKNPNDIFAKIMTARCLNYLYKARSEHTYSRCVSLEKRWLPDEFNTYLRFLNHLSLKDNAQIAYNYLNNSDKKYLDNESFLYHLLLAAKNAGKTEYVAKYKEIYNNKFPEGEYKTFIAEF